MGGLNGGKPKANRWVHFLKMKINAIFKQFRDAKKGMRHVSLKIEKK